ncbi:hypothetical protein HW932_19090 [Allochromatium humboldtianum]|uniref:Uncharacterized protein n=1 Tax=Allochromatium humboldtianum TaxID=504901 RepID=A0A850R9F4_9GAMM|nr:hypothetical protein [Allochromatium humboldtianum]NVZ11359.1 hypothetical protein [Allochromatium humboldtianum]
MSARLEQRLAALERHHQPTTTSHDDWLRTLSVEDLRFLRDIAHRQGEQPKGSGLVAMDQAERARWLALEQDHAQFVARQEGRV